MCTTIRRGLAAAFAVAGLVSAAPGRTQVLDPIQYQLAPRSRFEYGCFDPCACPVAYSSPMSGSFTFYRTSVDPLYTHYALLNIAWKFAFPDGGSSTHIVQVTGHGTYDIGGEVAWMQRMTLDVSLDGAPPQHFDSGLVPTRAVFPIIDIDAHASLNGCIDSIFTVVAAPPGAASVPPRLTASMLRAAGPNPSSTVETWFSPPVSGRARVEVIDLRGRVVAVLVDGAVSPRDYRLRWDGRDARGRDAGAGVFWLRATLGARSDRVRWVRLK